MKSYTVSPRVAFFSSRHLRPKSPLISEHYHPISTCNSDMMFLLHIASVKNGSQLSIQFPSTFDCTIIFELWRGVWLQNFSPPSSAVQPSNSAYSLVFSVNFTRAGPRGPTYVARKVVVEGFWGRFLGFIPS